MRRAFTTREKILLVILVVMLIAIGYFKLILEPINNSIANFQAMTGAEQDEMVRDSVILRKMQEMRRELEEIYASGDSRPLPAYSNADRLLVELNRILAQAVDCKLNFGATSVLEDNPIFRRPLELTFTAESYRQARSILDQLHDSDNINQISDLSVRFLEDGSVEVSALIAYFERME